MGGERRGVGRRDDAMARAVDERAFFLRVTAPENEDEMFAPGGERMDDGVGERFPAFALMRTGAVRFDGQRRVQEKDALIRPGKEIGDGLRVAAAVACAFLRDVDERGRGADARRDVEAKPLRLPRFVVGILSDDDDLDLVERRAVERREDFPGGRINGPAPIGILDERRQVREIGLLEFSGENVFPSLFDFHFHGVYFTITWAELPQRCVV